MTKPLILQASLGIEDKHHQPATYRGLLIRMEHTSQGIEGAIKPRAFRLADAVRLSLAEHLMVFRIIFTEAFALDTGPPAD
jgi:hypothetical protein